MNQPQSMPPAAQLRMLSWGGLITQSLAVVARLGVADELAAGPMDTTALAARVSANPDALYRIMRALASVGVFEEKTPRAFALTPLSELLRDDARPSFRQMAVLNGGDLYRAWGSAFDSATTGTPAFEHAFGMPYYKYQAENPDAQALFTRAMAGGARMRLELLSNVDFTGLREVLDVGGGDGTLMLGLLARKPELEGLVFDHPGVIEAAKANVAKAGLADRCKCVAGSFFEQPLPDADGLILAAVLHNFNDGPATAILRACRKAIRSGGRLLVLDDVVIEDNALQVAKLLDLQMLFVPGGRERTRAEWEALLRSGGFELLSMPADERRGLLQATPL